MRGFIPGKAEEGGASFIWPIGELIFRILEIKISKQPLEFLWHMGCVIVYPPSLACISTHWPCLLPGRDQGRGSSSVSSALPSHGAKARSLPTKEEWIYVETFHVSHSDLAPLPLASPWSCRAHIPHHDKQRCCTVMVNWVVCLCHRLVLLSLSSANSEAVSTSPLYPWHLTQSWALSRHLANLYQKSSGASNISHLTVHCEHC